MPHWCKPLGLSTSDVVTGPQLRLLATLDRLQRQYGYPPSLRQLAGELGYTSVNGAKHLVDRLRHKGLVTHQDFQARTLRVCVRLEAV